MVGLSRDRPALQGGEQPVIRPVAFAGFFDYHAGMKMIHAVTRFLRRLIAVCGVAFILLVGLCFTGYPWRVYYWLGTDDHVLSDDPAYIVVLGGGGIPSESGLVRTYYGAEAGRRFPGAQLIAALPVSGDAENSSTYLMREELVRRGIDRDRVLLEKRGVNTRGQAIQIRRMVGEDQLDAPILIVTCPEHMRRSLMTFRKAGFSNVADYSAFSTSGGGNMAYDTEDLEADLIPIVDGGIMLRYGFWNHLNYLTRSARELSALAYYRMKGWI